jgi:O-Antigen ligase
MTLARAASFGFYKMSPLQIVFLVATVVMFSVDGRGAMLAFIIPVVFAALMLGKVGELVTVLVVGLVIFSAAYAVETHFTVYHEPESSRDRSISTRQILENVASVVGQAGEQAEGTKVWRTEWWDIIVKNTLHGPNFWTGRGFGLNLADADGFQYGDSRDTAPLRSPHNVHMTMLARAVRSCMRW